MNTLSGAAIRWQKLGDFEHFVYWILDVDVPLKLVDFLIQYDADRIFIHRHTALTKTLVVAGEHRIYETSGTLREAYGTGGFATSLPGDVHRDGGGDQGAVVYYSVRGSDGVLFEVLDDDMKILATLSLDDFVGLRAKQEAVALQ